MSDTTTATAEAAPVALRAARGVRLHRFTARDYHAMARAGAIPPGARTELINGHIVTMSPVGSRHAWVVARLSRHFSRVLPPDIGVWTQSPIALGPRSEPEPDVMLLRAGAPTDRLPGPADVLLVVEVSDATLDFDRRVKLPLYARAGVPEVWIVDLTTGTVGVHRRPEAGAFAEAAVVGVGGQVVPSLLPGAAPVALDDLFAGL